MADVNLSLEVQQAGIASAIKELSNLRRKGQETGAQLSRLAQESRDFAKTVKSDFSGITGPANQYNAAITATTSKSTSLRAQLRSLTAGYKELTQSQIESTAAQRLTLGGRDVAEQVRNLRAMFDVDPVQDLIEVERQEAALSAANSNKRSAQAELRAAQDRRELQNMSAKERSAVLLTRAEENYNRAVAARKASFQDPTTGRFLPGTTENVNAQTAALRNEADAFNKLTDAQHANDKSTTANSENAFQSSYSYFILAGLATQAAQAIVGVGSASLTASAEIERSFIDVERTFEGTSAELTSLREKLVDLSTGSPVSFVDLAGIATLGNQLGVASADIQDFTSVIAQYTAVSGQSAEDAATAFGRISNLTGLAASQYENLASAITYTARTTVATEASIQNTAKEITALSSGAGFSAEAIVGLAGALSSLAIPPERARGALSLYFGALNSAVAEGGPKLQAFAELTNLTTENLESLVRQNKGEEVFTSFIAGLSDLDTVAKSSALDELGLSTIRVDQTMRALSQNVPLVTQSLEGANTAFIENTEIANQYSLIQSTLSAKWIEFQNAVQNAAGAVGDKFAPAAKAALDIAKDLIVEFTKFAESPIGSVVLTLAGLVAGLIAVLASLVGTLALAKASFVVLQFAMAGLPFEAGRQGIFAYIQALIAQNTAQHATAGGALTMRAAIAQSTLSLRASATAANIATVSLKALRTAMALTGVGLAIVAIAGLYESIQNTINPARLLTDDLTGLTEALKIDNPDLVKSLAKVATGSSSAVGDVSDFNRSILAAIEVQKDASEAVGGTTEGIDAQRFALGAASDAWIAEALKSQKDIRDLIDGPGDWDWLIPDVNGSGALFNNQETFENMLLGDLDLVAISKAAVDDGEEAALAQYDAWSEGYLAANPDQELVVAEFRDKILPRITGSVTGAYKTSSRDAALAASSVEAVGTAAIETAEDFDELGNYTGSLSADGEALAATFSGVTNNINDLRDAVQSTIGEYVDFDEVMKRAAATADLASGGTDTPVDALGFGKALDESIAEAENFSAQIIELAEGGSTSFALQLAELGPEASGILADSLELGPDARAKLEASARYAAFLASDAFKNQMEVLSETNNQAYARILQGGGDLDTVQDYIMAQVSGTGEAWEKAWLLEHPNLPLNITPELKDPTDGQIEIYKKLMEDKITIVPKVELPREFGEPTVSGTTYKDEGTGARVTLPADLDGAALTASLAIWDANQDKSPTELAALLNRPGLSEDLDGWISAHGPVTVQGVMKLQIPEIPSFIVRAPVQTAADQFRVSRQHGGEINAPKFATGGQYGQVSGPGNGTSDSIWARLSNGEFINQTSSVNFWGTDFFDALNRNMLPTSFLNMLGAAASGGGGPQNVTNVNVNQINPVTRDPLKQLRQDSEMLATGLWS